MTGAQHTSGNIAANLASALLDMLQRERLVPRFVDSYVVEKGRQALQAHPARYRELLALLTREALLAMTIRALEEAQSAGSERGRKPARRPKRALGGPSFRRNFLAALAKQQKWSAGDSLEFQSDLRMYEELLARRPAANRARKPFEAADHPFVDRCAFLLDSSFLEQARVAASRALADIENATSQAATAILPTKKVARKR